MELKHSIKDLKDTFNHYLFQFVLYEEREDLHEEVYQVFTKAIPLDYSV